MRDGQLLQSKSFNVLARKVRDDPTDNKRMIVKVLNHDVEFSAHRDNWSTIGK